MGEETAVLDTFLGMALTDPTTGLPNLPYFCLIQNWEERRARRRQTLVRVLHLHVLRGGEAARRSLLLRICQEVRTSDLIASQGRDEFRVLLTSPDAERAKAIAERIEQLATALHETGPDDQEEQLLVRVRIEAPHAVDGDTGPCDPCDEETLFSAVRRSLAPRLSDAR